MSRVKRERGVLRVRLLGGFETRLSTAAPVTLPTRKAQALLAYLAVRPGHAHSRDKLAALLWADRGDAQARDSLRHTLVELRKVLPERSASLGAEGRAVSLDPAAVDVDVARFEALVKTASPTALAEAAELYGGDFLDGFVLREAPFEEWLVAERERLRELALGGLQRLLDHEVQAGVSEPAIRTALRLLVLDATQEIAHRALMRLYAQQGRRAAALRQYQTCVGILQRELGTDPEAATRELYRELVRRREEPASAPVTSAKSPAASPGPPQPAAIRTEPGASETPLVGRDGELAMLHTAFDEARWGRGRVVAIVGEAGVGKSRLIAELAAKAAEHDTRVLLGRCYESEQTLPFSPWVDALRTAGAVPDDPALLAIEPAWRAELARLFPELAAADLPAPTDDARRLFESVTRLIHSLATGQPVLLVLEDLHWADEMTLRVVAFLGRRISADRVLLVVTAREEELADSGALRRLLGELRGEGHVTDVAVPALSRPDTSSLVRSLSVAGGDPAATARLDERVWAASAGNAFVVVETLRALRDGLMLEDPARLSLPQRVRDVIAGRMERLSERSRHLLAVAAVIGRDFDFALLERAGGLTAHASAEAVEELVRRRMLQGAGDGFDFTHDRIREVAYGSLLPPRRKVLHGEVGSALEALTADAIEPPAAAIGMHYRHAEVWEKAVHYLRRAGLQAAARSAHREAVVCFTQALEALSRRPGRRDAVEQGIDLRFDLRNALLPLADHAAIFAHLDAAEVLAARLGDEERVGRVACYRCLSFSAIGENEQAIVAGHRALATAARAFDVEVVAQAYLGMAYYAVGDFPRALEFSRKAGVLLTGERRYDRFGQVNLPAVSSGVHVAWSLAELGDFAEGSRVAEEIVRLAETTEQRYTIAAALRAAGLLYRRQGDLPRAIPALERGLALCRSADIRIFIPQIASILGTAYVLAGRPDEAVPLLDEMLERAAAEARVLTIGLVLTELGEALIRIGRLDEAGSVVGRLLEMSRTHPARGYEAHALRLQGELAKHRDALDIDLAAVHYREAMSLAEPCGMRPLVAHCRLGLGTLSQRAGQRGRAREHLGTAAAMYREIEMPFWLSHAEALLALTEPAS